GSTGEKTFTASWTIVRYPIIYILNGGTNAQNNPASYTVEDAVNLAAPIRAGYTFAGWSNGGTITVGSTGQKTFTASWVQSFPAPSEPEYDAEYEAVISAGKTQMGASEVFAPSRAGVVYTNPLPAPASLDTAASREELIEIANYYAFYRAGGFTVTLGYPADDAEVELTYLYRYSCFIPSICSVSGTLENRTLTVRLKFYPESYLVNPRTTVPAQILGGENDPPNGTDTLPGLDPVNGISVWDSEQACYCLSHGYKIAPIAGSPAEAIINAARTALAEIVDDSMTEWQIVYRVYRWLLEHSEYDYAGDEWSSYSFDKANESEMLPARVISFFAEGPILYGQGVCFGYAKAGELLLGLEGIELRRVVAFHWKIWDYTPVGRNWNILYDYGYGSEINVHSYLYLKIDGYDYIFDPSFAKNGKKSVLDQTTGQNVQILTMKDFAIGLTKSEHSTFYSEFPYDLVTESGNYNPGSYRYLSTVTYDGTHDLLLSSTAEAQHYYNFLLSTVFSGASDFRTVTLFYEADYSTWKSKYKQALLDFLNATNVPYKYTDASVSPTRTGANVMVTVVFGKRDDSYTPNVYAPAYDATYENKIAEGKSYLNASEIETPSRVGLTYPRKLPLSCSSDRAETRAELIEIANWHAFYREGTFSVTLGYEATDAETELNLLYRNSGFLPSLCALSGSLNGAVLTVNLKFYPETYLVVPPTAIAAACDGVILDPPAGAETFPGLDPVNGISVWDSEQAVYCLSHGYKIAPIAGSPAASIVETACGILSQISDDSLTEWEIVYRVFLWIMNHAVYDTDGEGWVYNSLDKDNEPDMISARMISFKAEGPLLYGVAACFGYAKASALLLGLEGIELRRVVAFDNGRIGAETDSRTYIKPNPNQAGSYYILVHSYLYLHIDGYDYIFDPTASGAGQRSVADRVGGGNASVRILRDFCLGMSYTEHRKIYNNYSPDPFAASDEYRPAMYNYLTELKYDGTHDLLISSTAEAQQYYTHLLNTVFSGEPAFRSITIFYDGMSLSTWKSQYRSALESFLNETGVPFSYTYSDISTKRTVADVMVQIAFGK
ncbi:MAG: InlB B-repeat-containing protein, partial [Clostridia bacterium]|nr:InlB B-repeat-containing protein [Clostridia bacterium]